MLNSDLPQNSCSKSAYIICFIVIIAIVIVILVYINNSESSESEQFLVASGEMVGDNDNLAAMGGIITNGRVSKPLGKILDESKHTNYVRDVKSDKIVQNNIDKLISNNAEVSRIMDEAQKGNLLSKEQMKTLATKFHEGEVMTGKGIIPRKTSVGKLMITTRPIGVMEGDGDNSLVCNPREANHTLYLTNSIYRVPKYTFDPDNMIAGLSLRDSEGFSASKEIITSPFDDAENRSKAIRESLLKSKNGKAIADAFNRAKDNLPKPESYLVNKNQIVVN